MFFSSLSGSSLIFVCFAKAHIFDNLKFSLETSPELEELPELVEELDVLQFPLKIPLLIAAANKESFSLQFSAETPPGETPICLSRPIR